jgi:hypothetical protein
MSIKYDTGKCFVVFFDRKCQVLSLDILYVALVTVLYIVSLVSKTKSQKF